MTNRQWKSYLKRNYKWLDGCWVRRLDQRIIIIHNLTKGKATMFTFPLKKV